MAIYGHSARDPKQRADDNKRERRNPQRDGTVPHRRGARGRQPVHGL